MSDKEKARFDDMAKQDKVRYDQEMMHYMPGGKRGKKKDPNAPKRPPWVDIPHWITSIFQKLLFWRVFCWFDAVYGYHCYPVKYIIIFWCLIIV